MFNTRVIRRVITVTVRFPQCQQSVMLREVLLEHGAVSELGICGREHTFPRTCSILPLRDAELRGSRSEDEE
jgi:hypothetical protein